MTFADRRSAVLDLALSMAARGVGAPLAMGANVLIGRLLGPEQYGVYVTLLSVGLFAGGLAAFGLGPVITREVAATESHGAVRHEYMPYLRWALRIATMTTAVAILLVVVWISFGTGIPASAIGGRVAVVALIPAYVLSTIATGLLAGMGRVAQSQAVQNFWKNALLLLGTAALLWASIRSATYVLWLQVFAYLLALAPGLASVSNGPSLRSRHSAEPTQSATEDRNRVLTRAARNFFGVSMALLLMGRLDVIIVNALAGSTEAGFFGAAARMAQFAALAGYVWIAWLQPRMSLHFRGHDHRALRRAIRIGFAGTVGMTGVLAVLGWLYAPMLVGLMGTEFEPAVAPFRLLLLGYVAWAASVPFNALLAMTGRESSLSRTMWMQTGLTLLLSVPLVHGFGALGGAWAWAGGLTAGSVIVIVLGGRHAYRLARTEG